MPPPAVETKALARTYRTRRGEPDTVALGGVDVEIRPGEIFGLLGPNGAGKTTLIKILSTLLLPTSGDAYVDGLHVEREAAEVRRRITMVSGGEQSGYGILTVRENIWMFSQFYGIPTRVAHERIDALLARLGMSGDARTRVNKLSTGMRQKMNIARGFVCDPMVLFLDEPTLGLDVNVSREVRGLVGEWVAEEAGTGTGAKRTVLLTTHYMQEADDLCDRVAVIDRGRVLACDAPAALKRRLRSESVFHLEVLGLGSVDGLAALPGVARLARVGAGDDCAEPFGVTRLSAGLVEEHAVAGLIAGIVGRGGRLVSLAKHEPTLEDVFVSLTGRALEAEEAA